MDLAEKQYLILYALIVISLAASFFFIRRSPAQPVKLRMDEPLMPRLDEPGSLLPGKVEPTIDARHEASVSPIRSVPTTALNAFFNWNGHSWDAYEVLGIPAGSSRDAAKFAFEKLAVSCDEESLLFFKAALDAILKSAVTRG